MLSNRSKDCLSSSTVKSGKNLSEKYSSAYPIHRVINPDNLLAISPFVLMMRSTGGNAHKSITEESCSSDRDCRLGFVLSKVLIPLMISSFPP